MLRLKFATTMVTMGLLGLLVSLGSATVTTSASAQGFAFCMRVTAGSGGFGNMNCVLPVGTRIFAIAYPGPGGLLAACLKVVPPAGKYNESACGKTGGTKEWEISATLEPVPSIRNKATTTTVISTTGTEVECGKETFATQPESGGLSLDGLTELSSCKVNKPANCTVKEPFKLEFNDQLEGAAKGLLDKLTGNKTGEGLANITFEGGSCSIAGAQELSGSQKCEFDTEIETLKLEHEVICKTSGSKLTFGGISAKYKGTYKQVLAESGTEGALAWGVVP